jgi:hypothetical protein
MDKSQSLSVFPYFDGSNYVYWKVRMRVFLKALDEHDWASLVKGWKRTSIAINVWLKEELNEGN